MIYIDSGASNAPEEYQTKGYYFRPSSHVCKHFIITITDLTVGESVVVSVHETGIPQENSKEILIANGDPVIAIDTSLVCSIKLFGKYFFPTFAENMQLYYDDTLYDDKYKKNKTDEVTAIAEGVNFAVKLGLEKANIKLY